MWTWKEEYGKRKDGDLNPLSNSNVNTEKVVLPVMAVTNVRSLLPKVRSVVTEFRESLMDILVITEVWEKDSQKQLDTALESALELEGIQYISCGPRPGAKRGGGAAIMSRNSSFTVRKLDVPCVGKLEVIWALARPKESGGRIKEFIVCGFYSPPRKGKNNQLVQHLVENVTILLRKYPDAGFYIAGDVNKMDKSHVLRTIPHCRQLVT